MNKNYVCPPLGTMTETMRNENHRINPKGFNLKGPRAKHKEGTMKPEKEASKYQDESLDQRIDRILDKKLDEKLDEKLKGILLTEKEHEEDANTVVGFDVFEMVKALVKPELTQKENDILKGLHFLGWKWIARDARGLCVYEKKPVRRDPATWDIDGDIDKFEDYDMLPISKSLPEERVFTFVQQADTKPTLIADLIQPEKKER